MTERLTITLPDDLAETVRRKAQADKRPVSQVIADALRAQERAALEKRMREGYLATRDEGLQIAEEMLPLANEAWPED